MNPTPSAKKVKKATPKSSEAEKAVEETKYLGCFASETMLIDRIYEGGSTGANYNLALYHAKANKKKYFAIARGGNDGHSFSFSKLDTSKGNMNSGGCERPCLDKEDKVCKLINVRVQVCI